jgi:hypothetical protein
MLRMVPLPQRGRIQGARRRLSSSDKLGRAGYIARPMILAASQFYFWYFGYPTPLAPAEDRLG